MLPSAKTTHPPQEPSFSAPWRASRWAAEVRLFAMRCSGGAFAGFQPLVAGRTAPLELGRLAGKDEARATTTTPARALTLPNATHNHADPARAADRAKSESTAVFFGCTGPNER